MGSKGRRGRDICLDEGEEGIGKEERTFAQDLLSLQKPSNGNRR